MEPMPTNGHKPRSGQDALEAIGFDGKRLIKLARRVAKDYLSSRRATLSAHRLQELESFLVEHALRAAVRYDPGVVHKRYGSAGGDPAASYLADIMEKRCIDWYRSKAEGNGDRRYGNDNRVYLAGDMRTSTDVDEYTEDYRENERKGWEHLIDRQVMYDLDRQVNFDVEREVSRNDFERWKRAAEVTDMSLYDFVVVAVDRAATIVLRDAA